MDEQQLTGLIRRAQGGDVASFAQLLDLHYGAIYRFEFNPTTVAEYRLVAGFAQLLRGGPYTGKLSHEDVLTEAQQAVGEDPFGYRPEFIELVNKAQRAR